MKNGWIRNYQEIREEVKEAVLLSLRTSTFIMVITRKETQVINGRNRWKKPADVLVTDSVFTNDNYLIVTNRVYAVVCETDVEKVFTPSLYITSEQIERDAFLYVKHNDIRSFIEFAISYSYIRVYDFHKINNILLSLPL